MDGSGLPKQGEPGFDKAGLVRDFSDALRLAFCEAYIPGESLSVDEIMLPFKGGLVCVNT